jgi:transposase
MKDVVRYSEAFKLRLVEDAANGKYQSLDEAGRRNGIRGCSTLSKWIKQYGREDILHKRVKVETMNEIDELQTERSRIRELEAALSDAHMDYCLAACCTCRFCGTQCRRHCSPTVNLPQKPRFMGGCEPLVPWSLLGGKAQRLEADSGLIEQNIRDHELAPYIMSVPGVGMRIAAAFLAYVGDGKRFSKPSESANYAGLVPRPDCSGDSDRYGHITKTGCRPLRAVIL